jgi:ABC-type lipoprotein release transport system permease subunit
MITKIAFRNIWRNRRRTLITAASVFFAVMLAVFMQSIQKGAWDNMQQSVIKYYFGYAQIQDKAFWDDQTIENTFILPNEQINAIEQMDNVKLLIPRLETFALVSYKSATKGALMLGIDPMKEEELSKVSERMIEGQFLENSTEASVLLSEGLAEYLSAQVGDTIVLLTQGFRGSNAAGKYDVRGIVRFGSPELNDQVLYLPLQTAQYFLRADDRLSSVVLHLKEHHSDALQKTVNEVKMQIDTSELTVKNWESMMPELVQARLVDEAGSKLILFILYILIGFGIFGTIIMMLKERAYEFGVLVSIGMKRRQLSLILWLEVLFIGLIGTIAGCIAASPIVYYFKINPIRFSGDMMEAYEKFGVTPVLPAAFDLSIFLSQALVVALIISLISLYPILKIMRLNPMESMRQV